MVLLEPVKELLEGQGTLLDHDLVVDGEVLGQARDRAAHDWVILLRLVLLDIIRLREHEERKGEVAESVLELGNIVEALSVLEDLVADNTSDHGRGRGDGGDDLSSDHLGLVAVALRDLVIAGTEVGAGVDEVDVEVRVVVLLEVGRRKRLVRDGCRAHRQIAEKLGDDQIIVVIIRDGLRGWCARSLALLSLFRSLNNDDFLDVGLGGELLKNGPDLILGKSAHADGGEDKVGAVVDKIEVGLVVDIEGLGLRRSLRA